MSDETLVDGLTVTCRKHGEISAQDTITLSVQVQPYIASHPDTELDPVEKGHTFCMECLNELLKKEIGVCSSN